MAVGNGAVHSQGMARMPPFGFKPVAWVLVGYIMAVGWGVLDLVELVLLCIEGVC